uniref:Integrator complex subunit 8-like n=1 Tax=Saccoglossus kowalevskii TaxID=10224 RepID=A0ABM0MN81_SACKO|nr:PREDICTED: integrator complex subunit 8-like [Saccoglossus kowalevskii]
MSEMVPRRPPSRQDTPLPVVWYEFLLNPNLLQQHLSKDDPDPNAVQLMAHFLGNVCLQQSAQQLPPPVLGGQNTEFNFGNGIAAVQNNVTTNGVEKKRTKMLKSLALQTAAHLDWNLNTIQNNLPMHLGHGLLKDFLKCTEAPIDVPLESLDISDMYDPPALALITYHRWCIRLLVSESFPAKPTKPSTLQGLGYIIDSLENSVLLLESILNIERTIALPSHVKIQQLANVSIDAQTEPMEKELEELIVNSVELHCQIAYDLGSLYFPS